MSDIIVKDKKKYRGKTAVKLMQKCTDVPTLGLNNIVYGGLLFFGGGVGGWVRVQIEQMILI